MACRPKCPDHSDKLSRIMCDFVNCVTTFDDKSRCVKDAENTVVLFQEAAVDQDTPVFPPIVSPSVIASQFPDITVIEKLLAPDTYVNEIVAFIDAAIAQYRVSKVILNVSDATIRRLFLGVAKKYTKLLFIANASVDQGLREEGVRPPNLFFSLQSALLFVPQVFNLRSSPSDAGFLIITLNGDPYLDYVAGIAVEFGITVISPEQVAAFADQIKTASLVYFSVYDKSSQLLAAQSLPTEFQGSILFIQIPASDAQVVDALPASAFNVVLLSPGCGTVVHKDSAWSIATRQSFASFPTTSVMAVFYYLSFIEELSTFAARDIVLDKNVANYRLFINNLARS